MPVPSLNKDNFKSEVLEYKGAILVDFFAPWCGPCQMVTPIIDELVGELPTVKFVKVNVDENPELAAQYAVFSIPTLLIFKDGKMVTQLVGAQSKESLIEELGKIAK